MNGPGREEFNAERDAITSHTASLDRFDKFANECAALRAEVVRSNTVIMIAVTASIMLSFVGTLWLAATFMRQLCARLLSVDYPNGRAQTTLQLSAETLRMNKASAPRKASASTPDPRH